MKIAVGKTGKYFLEKLNDNVDVFHVGDYAVISCTDYDDHISWTKDLQIGRVTKVKRSSGVGLFALKAEMEMELLTVPGTVSVEWRSKMESPYHVPVAPKRSISTKGYQLPPYTNISIGRLDKQGVLETVEEIRKLRGQRIRNRESHEQYLAEEDAKKAARERESGKISDALVESMIAEIRAGA